MTAAEHAAQRNAVAVSLLVESARLTLHDVYPDRSPRTGRNGGETVPGTSLAGAVAYALLRELPDGRRV
jgi:hypothetical protein